MPWQDPQSWRTSRTSSFCRAASGSAAIAGPTLTTVGSALTTVAVDNKNRAKTSLLANNDQAFHFRMRSTSVRIAAGLRKLALPAFVRKHPLRLAPAFLRKHH